ncbi:hypothetical protein [Streptomyces sp. NPDC048663]|uniref:hypothetical protein n=1 Tax=Streptomyces sp. NPDC048663 TaxID=3155638 RepID=UPI003417F468
MKKITSANLANSADGPWQTDAPNTPWFVAGIAYTDVQAYIDYFQRNNYQVEDGDPDSTYLTAVAKLKDQATRTARHSSVAADAGDPGRRNYFR